MQSKLVLKEKESQAELQLKEKDLQLKEKDLQTVVTIRDKDLEMLRKDILQLGKELLQSKQTVTSRGIFEYMLKDCQSELPKIKGGAFNAKLVCDTLLALSEL